MANEDKTKSKNRGFSEELKKLCGFKRAMELPSGISFAFDKNNAQQIRVTLGKDAATKNMQNDNAAFEGWILAIFLKYHPKHNFTVVLDADENFEKCGKAENNGHYNRCIYRINRFSKQFSSFVTLSDRLRRLSDTLLINGTEENIDSVDLVVNRPDKAAGINTNPEIVIEALFSQYPEQILNATQKAIHKEMDTELNRQLPVGVFKESVGTENKVFTAGHAAVDLWSMSKDLEDICIYELKKPYDNNKVGIVSELFFYANLMHDVYCETNNFGISAENRSGRGFEKILEGREKNGGIKKVHAFFLVKELHKEIKDVVSVLNQNSKINYYLMEYDLHIRVK